MNRRRAPRFALAATAILVLMLVAALLPLSDPRGDSPVEKDVSPTNHPLQGEDGVNTTKSASLQPLPDPSGEARGQDQNTRAAIVLIKAIHAVQSSGSQPDESRHAELGRLWHQLLGLLGDMGAIDATSRGALLGQLLATHCPECSSILGASCFTSNTPRSQPRLGTDRATAKRFLDHFYSEDSLSENSANLSQLLAQHRSARVALNELHAAIALRQCAELEAEFYAFHGHTGYWVEDLSCLVRLTTACKTDDVQLNPALAAAGADLFPFIPFEKRGIVTVGGSELVVPEISLSPTLPAATFGYHFYMWPSYDSVSARDNRAPRLGSSFCILAVPAKYGKSGVRTLAISERMSVFWKDTSGELPNTMPQLADSTDWAPLAE